MMSIPLYAGFSPSRWRQIIDVMLNKKEADHRVHCLRIVALQESDFNQCNRMSIGRPLLHALEDNKDIPDIQQGSRPSKLCHSAILNKQLTFNIHRIPLNPSPAPGKLPTTKSKHCMEYHKHNTPIPSANSSMAPDKDLQ